jgi:ribosomal protein S6--L-glutamate ligase
VRIALVLRPELKDRSTMQMSRSTEATVAALGELGDEVELILPEARAWDLLELRPRRDLYVLKSKTPLALGLASALAAAGAPMVNTVESTRLAKDKIAHTPLLAAAGVPVPPSWAVGSCAALRELLTETAGRTVWLKPPAGSMAAGIRRVCGPEEVRDEDEGPDPLLAQGEFASDGQDDLKIYVAGEWTSAVRRPPPGTAADLSKLAEPVDLPSAIRDAALACGRALGLELYGVDVLTNGDDFTVVDVNAYPGYGGLPEAPARIAAYLHHRAITT